jgi:hypothetical protein
MTFSMACRHLSGNNKVNLSIRAVASRTNALLVQDLNINQVP